MRRSTLRQLEVFEAIVRFGSFTRAAEELFLFNLQCLCKLRN
jgi:LysR family transcriptional regulator, low CO2-responsive transcriptional regulator